MYGNQYEWRLGDIAPGSSPSVVNIQLKSESRGNQQLCFEISSETDQLRTEACAQTEIVVPCLGLQIDGPTEATIGQQITFDIVVVNQCEEPLDDVELKILYEDGLNATGFGNPIGATIGRLDFNERKSLPVVFDVMKSGRQCFEFKATASGGHTANGKRCVDVKTGDTANVNLQLEGQRRVIVGGRTLIRGIVSNVGAVPLSNVTVINRFSPSLVPDMVTDKYPHRWTDGRGDELIFDLGTLAAGETAYVELQYLADQIDGNAFSEMTVSSPDVAPSTRRYDMRIEDLGSAPEQEPGIGIPDDGSQGGQGGVGQPAEGQGGDARNGQGQGGVQPDFGNDQPSGEGPIQIPDDPAAQGLGQKRGDLSIRVRTLDRQIALNGPCRIEFTITNNSSVADSNVDISMLLPPSIRLVGWSDQQNPLPIVANSGDNTRFDLQRVLSMRPSETLSFVATVQGVQPGVSTFEVRAASDNSVGTVTANDTVMVVQ